MTEIELSLLEEKACKEIKLHSVYRHFKGNFYYVNSLVESEEDGRVRVAYQALYGDNEMYSRDIINFLYGEVKDRKDNTTGQKYRFEPIPDLKSYLDNKVEAGRSS
jgi:hypothetical protein